MRASVREDKGREVIGSDLKVMGNVKTASSAPRWLDLDGVALQVSVRNQAIVWFSLLGAVK